MKTKVDEELCCGCGPCEEICPQVFKIIDDIARVQMEAIPVDLEEKVREAMENCPTGAITIEE